MNIEIKAVFFDIGGVVFTSIQEAFLEIIMITFDQPTLTPDDPILNEISKLNYEYEKHLITEKEFWKKVAGLFHKPLPDNWSLLFTNVFKKQQQRPSMVALIEQLKAQGITVYALTNVSAEKAKSNKKAGYYAMFDDTILSCDIKKSKPDREIYEYALQKAHVSPEESLFIDDKLENVVAAQTLGIHAIHFITEEQFFSKLKSYFKI